LLSVSSMQARGETLGVADCLLSISQTVRGDRERAGCLAFFVRVAELRGGAGCLVFMVRRRGLGCLAFMVRSERDGLAV